MIQITSEKNKKAFKNIFWIIVILTLAMYWFDQYVYYFTDEYYLPEDSFIEESLSNEEDFSDDYFWCSENSNVGLINIHGQVVTYLPDSYYSEDADWSSLDVVASEDLVYYIEELEEDADIEVIIVEIDSYGGMPTASEEVMKALKRVQKPTIALIREGGASGAYLIATGADKIFASEMSDVGGIGITMSYLDYSQQNEQEGIIYQQLSSGKFKDSGDPDKELTAEEKALYMRDIQIIHDAFVKDIAENRGLEIEKVERLADGSTLLGQAAKENGLIDEIGDLYDVKEWIRKELGIEPIICVY